MSKTNVLLFPYNWRSRGAKELMKALEIPLHTPAKLEVAFANPGYPKDFLLINWGSGSLPTWLKPQARKTLNPVTKVNICRNKLKFFSSLDKTRVPEFTADIDTALDWVQKGLVVMGRQSTGSCGTDIVFYEDDPERFQASEFWVQYKKKKHEFRIHIFNGDIISMQQKSLRTTDIDGSKIDTSTVDFRIRNHKNGFIFQRHNIAVPEDVQKQALLAAKEIGIDFGAVDVIYNQHEGKAYVLEINTAPGLEGTTVSDYVSAFKSIL